MAISMMEALRLSRCGQMTFLCCIPRAQWPKVRDILAGMSDADLSDLADIVCGCAVPGQPPPPPGNGSPGNVPIDPGFNPASTCGTKLMDASCSTSGKALTIGAQIAISAAGAIAPASLQPLIASLALAVTTIQTACANQQIDAAGIAALCRVAQEWIDTKASLPGPILFALGAIDQLFDPKGVFGMPLAECCKLQPAKTGSATLFPFIPVPNSAFVAVAPTNASALTQQRQQQRLGAFTDAALTFATPTNSNPVFRPSALTNRQPRWR